MGQDKKIEADPINKNRNEKVHIIKIEQFNANDFVLPEPPKKIRKIKSNEIIQGAQNLNNLKSSKIMSTNNYQNQKVHTYAPETANNLIQKTSTGITQGISSLEIETAFPTEDLKISKYFENAQMKESTKIVPIVDDTEDINKKKIEVYSQPPLFNDDEHSQIDLKTLSSSKSSQETTFSQKMSRWELDFATYKVFYSTLFLLNPYYKHIKYLFYSNMKLRKKNQVEVL